ncbi:MAG: ISL3 family transposase, partial [Roseibacillus sp.]|nr:ISL3 family transposase [Roseibacillus sp.]
MQDRTLYARLLGIEDPWRVTEVTLRLDEEQAVVVSVEMGPDAALLCPKCQGQGSRYDSRERRWRHLDTMQYRTILVADVPRVQCDEHGVVQIAVPWSDPKSRFTALFEALVIDWLKEASFSAVARQLSLSWDQVAGIQDRAVRRGLARRKKQRPRRIGVDETSFRKRAEYITVVNDLDRNRVLWIGDERKKQTLSAFYADLGPRGCARLESVAMDMWAPYISSTREHVPDADRRIVFDKFHIAQHLGRAVDEVRRAENRELVREGDGRLKKTKYLWLTNPDRMSTQRWEGFAPRRDSQLRVARAWAIKESAMMLWGYIRRGWAERAWKGWYAWAIRSRLEPIKRVARLIKYYWDGVINAATTNVTNARSEGLNSKIQWIKRKACGYRNRQRFHNAIYF